jgi:hypothetical protein
VALLPLSAEAFYLGGNRLRLTLGRRDIDFAVIPSGHYPDRFTRDLVAFWNGQSCSLRMADYKMPWVLGLLAWLPIGIALVLAQVGGLIGGLLGGVIAAAVYAVNLSLIRRERWSLALRVALSCSLNLAVLTIISLCLLGLFRLALRGADSPGTKSNSPTAGDSHGIKPGTASPEQPEPIRRIVADMGAFEDPSGDCHMASSGDKTVIDVPGTMHDLSMLPGRGINAPRILSEVDGDFQVEVQVDWKGSPVDPPAPSSPIAFHGAGILVWSTDEIRLLRLERAAFVRNGELQNYVLFEQQSRGGPTQEYDGPCNQGPLQLRLARRGNLLLGSYRGDGTGWRELPPQAFVSGKVRVGVAAVNTSSRPLEATFTGFSLHQP